MSNLASWTKINLLLTSNYYLILLKNVQKYTAGDQKQDFNIDRLFDFRKYHSVKRCQENQFNHYDPKNSELTFRRSIGSMSSIEHMLLLSSQFQQ